MSRQSISFTAPNDDWLKSQIENNDLIRQARGQQAQIDWIKAKLSNAENSGFTTDSKKQILEQSKSLLNG